MNGESWNIKSLGRRKKEPNKTAKEVGSLSPSLEIRKNTHNQPLVQKKSMAADPEWWNQWTQQNPLYHVTAAHNVPSILKHGLIPWDDRQNPNGHGWENDPDMAPRPGHVYLGNRKKIGDAYSYVDGPRALLKVDPSKLDPNNVAPDEDAFAWNAGDQAKLLGFPKLETTKQTRSLGQQANDLELSRPEHTKYGLEATGSLAHYGPISPEAISLEDPNWNGATDHLASVQSNILDPIFDCLDSTVFDNACGAEPILKPVHAKWILNTVIKTLKKHGYSHMEEWLSIVMTGSLTTYQYSADSDCDVSLFVDTEHFPEWSRAEMIGVMVGNVDGTKLPGTTHDMQCYVVPREISKEQLYQPGLRSGYDIQAKKWIVPPEKGRVHNIEAEMNGYYVYALQAADKVQQLLRYEPDKAVQYWHQLHVKRQADMIAGKGDFSESNVAYKMLNNRGLFPLIEEASGEHIAKTANLQPFFVDERAVEKARQHLNLQNPVNVSTVNGTSGGYRGIQNGVHQVNVVNWLRPESASKQIWHELAHARQYEQDPEGWDLEQPTYDAARAESHEAYRSHPWELDAHELADSHPFPLALPRTSKIAAKVLYDKFDPDPVHPNQGGEPSLPWIYDPETQVVHLGPVGAYHWHLLQRTPELQGKFNSEEAWQGPAMNTQGLMMGAMSWPSKKQTWLGNIPDEHKQAINEALGGPPLEPNWGF